MTGERVIPHWLSSLSFFFDPTLLALLGVRKAFVFYLFFYICLMRIRGIVEGSESPP